MVIDMVCYFVYFMKIYIFVQKPLFQQKIADFISSNIVQRECKKYARNGKSRR